MKSENSFWVINAKSSLWLLSFIGQKGEKREFGA